MTSKHVLIAGALFGLTKAAFGFLGWLLEPEDRVFKKHLDALWDRLHEGSLHSGAIRVLAIIHDRLQSKFDDDSVKRGFFWCCFVINYVASIFALGVLLPEKTGLFAWIASFTWREYFALSLLAIVLAFLSRGSLELTIRFLRHVVTHSNLKIIIGHIVLQIAVTFVVFAVAMAYFNFIIAPGEYHVSKWPGGTTLGVLSRIPELLTELPLRPTNYFVFLGILTLTCAFPTAVYLAVLAATCLIWPRWIWLLVRRVVFLIASNKTPVLNQLGNFCGGIAAAIALIAGLLK
jgi:hypothetical protein